MRMMTPQMTPQRTTKGNRMRELEATQSRGGVGPRSLLSRNLVRPLLANQARLVPVMVLVDLVATLLRALALVGML